MDFYDSDEENKHDDLEAEASGIKNFNEEEAKKKREQDQLKKEQGGFDMIFKQEADQKKSAPAEPAPVKKAAGGPIMFNKGGKPTFSRGGASRGTGFNSKEAFPGLNEFPSMDEKSKGAPAKAEESVAKCDQPQFGNMMFSSAAAKSGPREEQPEKKGGIDFSKRPPMFTRSTKAKTLTNDADPVHEKQNYDFGKMRMAAAA